MNVIIKENFHVMLYGFSGIAINKDYSGTAFKLMDKIWPAVRQHHLKNKGQNIWVFEPGEKVFAGIELEGPVPAATALEQKNITLAKYAYYKHVGPYNLIKQAGAAHAK